MSVILNYDFILLCCELRVKIIFNYTFGNDQTLKSVINKYHWEWYNIEHKISSYKQNFGTIGHFIFIIFSYARNYVEGKNMALSAPNIWICYLCIVVDLISYLPFAHYQWSPTLSLRYINRYVQTTKQTPTKYNKTIKNYITCILKCLESRLKNYNGQ